MKGLRQTQAPEYAIIAVNFIQSLDKAELIQLIALNAGCNKYVALLIAIMFMI